MVRAPCLSSTDLTDGAVRCAPQLGQKLSSQLRWSTRDAHAAVEAAFDLNWRVANVARYRELLMALRQIYSPMEDALGLIVGWCALTPAIDVNARRRTKLIDEDLTLLGTISPDQWLARPTRSLPTIGSLAAALGCLYVLEGAAIGGQIISRRAREALGDQLPVQFFTMAGRSDHGREWRRFQSALDNFGLAHPQAKRDVVAAARETFAAMGDVLAKELRP
jgi:heme oxygenase